MYTVKVPQVLIHNVRALTSLLPDKYDEEGGGIEESKKMDSTQRELWF